MLISIVGGGPAGVSCATLLKRYGIGVVIYEKRQLGGLITNAWLVENFPLVEPASGELLAQKLREAVEKYNIPVVYDEIYLVKKADDAKKIKLVGAKSTYFSDIVVLATGTKPKRIEKLETSDRVVYEFRDLPDYVESVAFYGGGDVAFDGAIKNHYLGRLSTILVRNNKLKAVPRLVDEVKRLKIPVKFNEKIVRVSENNGKLLVETIKEEKLFDALLIAIGRESNLPKIEGLEIGQQVHIIGDAGHDRYRQSSIAVGDGIRCAMEIVKLIDR
ncbi:MAG: NAD(P)/FAD-dependent oxidoreductase [Fervidobacterium sp.]